jgi:hypothetical protein
LAVWDAREHEAAQLGIDRKELDSTVGREVALPAMILWNRWGKTLSQRCKKKKSKKRTRRPKQKKAKR